MEILNEIKQRYSPRSFTDKPLEQEQLDAIFEAAQWAPSSYNSQPWRYIVVRRENKERFKKVLKCLNDFNKIWTSYAPVFVIAVTKLTYDRNGKPYKHAWYDLGQSVGYMSLQATKMGLYTHQIGGFKQDCIEEEFHIPKDYAAVTIIVIGHKGKPDDLPEEYCVKPENRKRKDISELVTFDSFDNFNLEIRF